MGTEALLEREAELAALRAVLERACAGEGGVVFVEGAAGIGKSALLDAAASAAVEAGMLVERARADELDRDQPFATLRRALERKRAEATADDFARWFDGSATLLEPALDPGAADGRSTDPAVVAHGLFWFVTNRTADGPLAIVVDDAHWADTGSLVTLAGLSRRIEELRCVLVVAARPDEPHADHGQLAAIAGAAATTVVRPAELGAESTAAIVRAALGADPERRFVAACQTAAGGNPFLLTELVGALAAEGVAPVDAQAAQVEHLGPRSIARAVLLRLARLGPGATALAAAVAVLGDGAELHQAARLADLDLEAATDAADALAGAGVLAQAVPLCFAHPVIRHAVHEDLPAASRARLHARAAAVLRDDGVVAGRLAPHLLQALPAGEPWVVDALLSAGEQASSGGQPVSARALFARALREPPAPERRCDVLVHLGGAAFAAGDFAEAIERLEAAIEVAPDAAARARITLKLSPALLASQGISAALTVLAARAREVRDADDDLALRLDVEQASFLQLLGGPSDEVEALLEPYADRLRGETPAERLALANLAQLRSARGPSAEPAVRAARRAFDGGLIDDVELSAPAFSQAMYSLLFADDLEHAKAILDATLERARRRGDRFGFAVVSSARAHCFFRLGRITDAEAEARAALGVAGDHFMLGPGVTATLIDCLVERGDVDAAEAALRDLGEHGELGEGTHHNALRHRRGRLRLAQERFDDAWADFKGVGAWDERAGIRTHGLPWREHGARALVRLGREDEALALARDAVAIARAWGTGPTLGCALRCEGELTGGAEGVALLREACAALEDAPAALERAYARHALGAALRRAGERVEARALLEAAVDEAQRCGATALADRADEELRLAGARPRRRQFSGLDALTAAERRVATMVAEGRSNREVAEVLFLTPKTVENHLGRVYAKLGIGGRRELGDALGDVGVLAAAS